jgi:hypothetical protein
MPREIDATQLRQLIDEGVSQREIARRLGVPRSTLQDHLKQLEVYPVHRGTPAVIPRSGRGTPEVDLPQTPAELDTIKADLLEVAAWWRARKMRRVDPSGPREPQNLLAARMRPFFPVNRRILWYTHVYVYSSILMCTGDSECLKWTRKSSSHC